MRCSLRLSRRRPLRANSRAVCSVGIPDRLGRNRPECGESSDFWKTLSLFFKDLKSQGARLRGDGGENSGLLKTPFIEERRRWVPAFAGMTT